MGTTKKPGEGLSLKDFAGDPRLDCGALAKEPLWAEVVEGYHRGIRPSVIRRWLIAEKGYKPEQLPTPETLAKYLRDRHSRS